MALSLLPPPEILRFEGVEYQVPQFLGLSHSFFLPTLNPEEAFKVISKHYSGLGYKLTWTDRIEQDLLGIRVWRLL